MKDTNGNIITEEEFCKGNGFRVEALEPWEKEFDYKFNHDDRGGCAIVILEELSQRPAQNEVKDFISSLLEQQKKEIIENCKKELWDLLCVDTSDREHFYKTVYSWIGCKEESEEIKN